MPYLANRFRLWPLVDSSTEAPPSACIGVFALSAQIGGKVGTTAVSDQDPPNRGVRCMHMYSTWGRTLHTVARGRTFIFHFYY